MDIKFYHFSLDSWKLCDSNLPFQRFWLIQKVQTFVTHWLTHLWLWKYTIGNGEIRWNPKINGAEPDLIAFYI